MRLEEERERRFLSRIFKRPQLPALAGGDIEKTEIRSEIVLPEEEIRKLMQAMDLLKMRSGYFHGKEDGKESYLVHLKKKGLTGLSETTREFMSLGAIGLGVKILFSYDQRDFARVRRSVSIEHRRRRIEFVFEPGEACEFNLENPEGLKPYLSEEHQRQLVEDALTIIKAGFSKLLIDRTGSS